MPPVTKKAVDTRSWTVQQRREAFLKLKASQKDDWRIVKENVDETYIPYGYITLDQVLGWKGVAHGGRVFGVHGNEHSGKSTLCINISRNYQQLTGEPVAVLDFERTLTSQYVRTLGIDESMLFLKRPDSIDQCAKDVLELMNNGVRLFTFDSIPRMKPKVSEKDIMSGDAFKMTVGKHAKAMQDFFDVLLPHAAEHDCWFMMVNQQRDRIEDGNDAKWAMKYPSFTNLPYTLPGGKSVRYVTAAMLELKTVKAFKAGGFADDPFVIEPGKNEGPLVITQVRARSLKNKITGGGFREGTFWLRPNFGMDENVSVRQMARRYKLIDYSGRTYFVGKNPDEAIVKYNSKEEAIQDLVIKQNPEVLGRLRALLVRTIDDTDFGIDVDASVASYMKGEETFGDDDEAFTSPKFEVENADKPSDDKPASKGVQDDDEEF